MPVGCFLVRCRHLNPTMETALDLELIDLARQVFLTVLTLAGPILMAGLAVGLMVSLFQALTSIQEQTLSLVPKMFAVLLVSLGLLAPGLAIMHDYTVELLERLVTFGVS